MLPSCFFHILVQVCYVMAEALHKTGNIDGNENVVTQTIHNHFYAEDKNAAKKEAETAERNPAEAATTNPDMAALRVFPRAENLGNEIIDKIIVKACVTGLHRRV